jgi:hypothetical protein
MVCSQDRLSLDALLADPLTQAVMRSDNITAAEVEKAFTDARLLEPDPENPIPCPRPVFKTAEPPLVGARLACWMC